MSSVKDNSNVAIVLLAAGGSTRLGRPKQTLSYGDATLLQHSLRVAEASAASKVVVVLGAQAQTILNQIQFGKKVEVVTNDDWENGIASSIHRGIEKARGDDEKIHGIIIMMCDQPYVNTALLTQIINIQQQTGKPIVACGYDNTFGPPVFFHHTLFDDLLDLEGDVGARSIVQKHATEAEIIPFPEGSHDIDTESDYEKLQSESRQ